MSATAEETTEQARQKALLAEAQRKLREAKARYGYPPDAGRES